MSFLQRFKKEEQPPPGVDLSNSSFAYQNDNSYKPPVIEEPTKSKPVQPSSRQKGKPGGGWESDSGDEAPKSILKTQPTPVQPPVKSEPVVREEKQISPAPVVEFTKKTYENIQLSRVQTLQPFQVLSVTDLEGQYEHEANLVTEVTKPGGILLKQSEKILKEFLNSAEHLQEQVVGSLLIMQLSNEDSWKIQARSLYAIEALSQAFQKYKKYFQYNVPYIQTTSDQQQLITLLNSVKQELQGVQITKQTADVQFEYIEPPKPVEVPPPQVQQKQQVQDLVSDILDLNITQPQPKKNAFDFLNKNKNKEPQQTVQTQQQPTPAQQPPTQASLLDSPDVPKPETKKANAFNFIKKAQSQPQAQTQTSEPTPVQQAPPPKQQTEFNLLSSPQQGPQSHPNYPPYQYGYQNQPQQLPYNQPQPMYPMPHQMPPNQFYPPQQPYYPPPMNGQPYYPPPYGQPYPQYYPPQQYVPPQVDQHPAPQVKLESEKKPKKDESAFDFIKI